MSVIASQITDVSIGLLNHLLRRISKKASKLHVTALCAGIQRWPVNSLHKGPVTPKMFPFDDVIMLGLKLIQCPTSQIKPEFSAKLYIIMYQ